MVVYLLQHCAIDGIAMGVFVLDIFGPLYRWHLEALYFITQVLDHVTIEPKSRWSWLQSSFPWIDLYRRQSSANSLIVVDGETLVAILLTKRRNIRGPNTVPLGTPDNTS